MAKKTHKLELEGFSDFMLFGLVTAETDYRLSWLFNSKLGLSFSKFTDVEVLIPKTGVSTNFVRYQCVNEEGFETYQIIKNKVEGKFFLPEHKEMDYILVITGDYLESDITKTIETLKAIDTISVVLKIDVASIKSKAIYKIIDD